MKKIILTLFIILVVGLIIGVVGIGFYFAGGGIMKDAEKKTQEIKYSGEDLLVQAYFDELVLTVTESEKVTFEYYENDNVKREIANGEGEISFKTVTRRGGMNFLFLCPREKRTVKIALPKGFCGEMEIKNETGGVDIDLAGETLKGLNVNVTTGSVRVSNVKSDGELRVAATTGSVRAEGVSGKNVELKATTGSVDVKKISAEGIELACVTGGVNGTELSCESLKATATTGSINVEVADAGDIYLSATTGGIKAKIKGVREEFNIEASATTGKCNLQNATAQTDKKLFVKTTTGSSNVEFVK